MDLAEIYHFIFETYAGIGCLVGAGIVISKTRRVFRDRGERPEDRDEENESESE